MKNINLSIVIVFFLALASCMELDQFNPNRPTVESFWQTEDDVYTGLMGAYAMMQEQAVFILK